MGPTSKPTYNPTSFPTILPTLTPSSSYPSAAPTTTKPTTSAPTNVPTHHPLAPTMASKKIKSQIYYADPTSFPTTQPSTEPTAVPNIAVPAAISHNNEENASTLRFNAVASYDGDGEYEFGTDHVSREYDEDMVSEDGDDVYGDEDGDRDGDTSTNKASGYDMNRIYLSSGIMLGSLCIICAGLIFVSLCCFAGMKKRSDGLTDIEWCCYANGKKKKKIKTKKGHIAVGNDTDDEDIMYDDTMHMGMNEECTMMMMMIDNPSSYEDVIQAI